MENRKALVIGVSEYDMLDKLPFCRHDGIDVASLLTDVGYDIPESNKLMGDVRYNIMRNAAIKFFMDSSDNTLLFYYSGHGVPDTDGQGLYLGTSDIDPDSPIIAGLDFSEVAKLISRCKSPRVIGILDCCYSGSAQLTTSAGDPVKKGINAINSASRMLEDGVGRCLLASSQSTEEAFNFKKGDNSLYTSFLLDGLKGKEDSVDAEGNVTVDTISRYVHNSIANLPYEKRPKQTPIKKVEAAGDIILATYQRLAKPKVQDLLKLLQAGNIIDFNKTRDQSRYTYVDLHAVNLVEANLAEANLAGADLRGTDLTSTNLSDADLRMARLSGANLSEAYLNRANLRQADLSDAVLIGANLSGANLSGADLSGAKLRMAVLREANLSGADLRGAVLNKADLGRAVLTQANLFNAKLQEANLSETRLERARFRGADLSESVLNGADLSETDFRQARLDKSLAKDEIKRRGGIV